MMRNLGLLLFGCCLRVVLATNASDPTPLNVTYPAITNDSSVGQQNIQAAPPLPILAIGDAYMLGQLTNVTHVPTNQTNTTKQFLHPRDDGPIQCGPGSPCLDSSCCNSAGKCGFGSGHCSQTAPISCISNCDATAMCGRDSEGANLKCGENLCCSYFGWCGTTELHCNNSDPIGGVQPCQQGFGGCTVVPSPVCDPSQKSSSQRKIGYYNANNVNTRPCNKVAPSQINTDGFTHLNFAFAAIDPSSYQVVPMNQGDEKLYYEFTALQRPGLETWLSIGGFDFSDPGPTEFTWSNMASTSSSRAAFIASVKAFLSKYGFQGVDLDWEYPSAPERGGQVEDITNQVSLVSELKAALGSEFGLSVVLAPDYWYLRGSDPKGMEPYVDWFGFMSYDLHGFWDADNPSLGNIIRPQTDIRDIINDTLPLWFDYLDPKKVNFGLAYYGRGFTVSDTSCMYPGCRFAGPSRPAGCTQFSGVMSLLEIEQVIADKHLVPELLKDPLVKQITWGDQWIGYDDNDTIAMKIAVADGLCFGGTMVWSVDFDSIGSGGDDIQGDGSGGNVTYFDPSIWFQPNPSIQCIPPCTMVLPPWPLSTTLFLDWPPWTTYLMSSTAGSVVTKTTIINVPPFTITDIPFWPVTAMPDDPTTATLTAIQSIMPPSLVLTLPGTEATFPPTQILPPSASPTSAAQASSTYPVSPNGNCGAATGFTCLGSSFGNCCSSYGNCGSSSAYCGGGCDPMFGTCDTAVSNNGQCGAQNGGQTCKGSSFGDCCSTSGYCGSTEDYCITYCDPNYGICSGSASSSSTTVPPSFIFGSTSHVETVQPMPTSSVLPPAIVRPTITYTSAPPQRTCESGICGSLLCEIFGCPPSGCGIFGCDGGCGLFGCGGFPDIHGPNPTCPLTDFILGRCNHGPGGGGSFGDDPNPDDQNPNDPDPEDENPEECKPTQTGAECFAYCTVGTSDGTTSTTCTSTSCITGIPTCTAASTTETMTITSTDESCPSGNPPPATFTLYQAPWGGCYPCNSPQIFPDDIDDDLSGDDDDGGDADLSRRGWSRAMPRRAVLEKRAANTAPIKYSTLTASGTPTSCALPSKVTIPGYVGGAKMSISDAAGPMDGTTANMVRWLKATTSVVDCLPTVTQIPVGNQVTGPSIDHAWEKKWMMGFFVNTIFNDNAACGLLLQTFFSGGNNCLQTIFDAAPGLEFWDMVGMSGGLNQMKGKLANPQEVVNSVNAVINEVSDLEGDTTLKPAQRKKVWFNGVTLYNQVLQGCMAWADNGVFQTFDRTNNRIYGRLIDIDNYAQAQGLPQYNWAQKYRSYITLTIQSVASTANNNVLPLRDFLLEHYDSIFDFQQNPNLVPDMVRANGQLRAGVNAPYNLGTDQSVCNFEYDLTWQNVPDYRTPPPCGTGPRNPGDPGQSSVSNGGSNPTATTSESSNPTTGGSGPDPTPTPPNEGGGGPTVPTSAGPGELLIFADSMCQEYIDKVEMSKLVDSSGNRLDYTSGVDINSYIVGSTPGCGCEDCYDYDIFAIANSDGDGCNKDSAVGGGCAADDPAGTGQKQAGVCYQTGDPAPYVCVGYIYGDDGT